MNLNKFLCTGICAYFLFIGLSKRPDKECVIPSSAVFPFAEQELDLSKEELRSLIQTAVDTMYLKGFRYLGDPRDFDHGHLLYTTEQPLTAGAMPPVAAILYHTQEDAFDYHIQHPGSRFDYVDRWARNWVQLIHSKKVGNAQNFVLKNLDYNYEINHFTIHEDMLDNKLIGVELSRGYSKQFLFEDVSSKNIPYECRGDKSNLVSIRIPSGEYKIIALLGNKYFWPYYENYWKKEHGIK